MSGIRWPAADTFPVTQGFAGSHPWEPAGYLQVDAGGPRRARRADFAGAERREDLHAAVDIACPIGTPLFAVEAGKVVAAGVYSSTGEKYLMIRIHRDDKVQTIAFYTHLSRVLVPVGARVTRGQKVALSGNSGMSTGPHLHFEVRVGPATADAWTSTSSRVWFRWNPKRLRTGGDLAGVPFIRPT